MPETEISKSPRRPLKHLVIEAKCRGWISAYTTAKLFRWFRLHGV